MFLILPSKEGKESFEAVERKLLTLNFEEVFDKMGVVFGDILLPRMEMVRLEVGDCGPEVDDTERRLQRSAV